MRLSSLCLVLTLALLPLRAHAEILVGEVVGVTDGDTLRIVDAAKRQHVVRLAAIDTPERRQAFYQRARQALADLVFRKRVEVRWEKRDRWNRIVGTVLVADPTCTGACAPSIDVGLRMVEMGHAWWFRRYAKEQAPEDRARYEAAEKRARAARLGLWSDPNPIPPWEFRKKKRAGSR